MKSNLINRTVMSLGKPLTPVELRKENYLVLGSLSYFILICKVIKLKAFGKKYL